MKSIAVESMWATDGATMFGAECDRCHSSVWVSDPAEWGKWVLGHECRVSVAGRVWLGFLSVGFAVYLGCAFLLDAVVGRFERPDGTVSA